VNAEYDGISAYSSKHREEVAFRRLGIKDFVRRNNNPSGKIAELYDTINRIFDGYVATLNDEKAAQKKRIGAINEIQLNDMQKNYKERGTGDGENTEAIVKLKQTILSGNKIDFDQSLNAAEDLRKQFLACLDNLCEQFHITKRAPVPPAFPAPEANKSPPQKKRRASKLIALAVVVLVLFAIFYRPGSTARRQEIQGFDQSPLSVPASGADSMPETNVPEPVDPFSGFIRITGGTFVMGSPETEEGHEHDETQRTVTLDDFYIGEKEITLAEFKTFIKETGFQTLPELSSIGFVKDNGEMIVKSDATYLKPYIYQDDNHPVVEVSWYDAIEYCNWRSQRENLTPVYKIDGDTVEWDVSAIGYRLPAEAEWEYACRAGSDGPYYAGFSDFTPSPEGTKAVSVSSPANSWGLYDFHTNVSEWCWDVYDELQDDTSIPGRVVRGGNWSASAQQARSAYRSAGNPKYGSNIIGFRIALSIK
jgi:formylglycine-generating enzyme required for sulfatase activity